MSTAPTRAGQPGTAVAARGARSPQAAVPPADDPGTQAREQLRTELARFSGSFAKVLPRHLTAERLVTLTLVAATKTPKLFECSPESIALAVMRIGQWGLEIGTTAHLVPFWDKQQRALVCTPIADWKGKIELGIRSGVVRKVTPRAVYAGEHFVVRYGAGETLEHHPAFAEGPRELTHVYAIAWLRGGLTEFEVLSRAEVEAVRQRSPMPNSPAWAGHFAEMAKKTVVHKLLKRLPQSAQLADAFAAEESVALADASGAALAAGELRALPPAIITAEARPLHDAALVAAMAEIPDPYEPAAEAPRAAAAPSRAAPMTLEQAKAYPYPFQQGKPQHGKPLDSMKSDFLQNVLLWIVRIQEEKGEPGFHADTLEAIRLVVADREKDQLRIELDPAKEVAPAADAPKTVNVPPPGKVADALTPNAPRAEPAADSVAALTKRLKKLVASDELDPAFAGSIARQLRNGELGTAATLEHAIARVQAVLDGGADPDAVPAPAAEPAKAKGKPPAEAIDLGGPVPGLDDEADDLRFLDG